MKKTHENAMERGAWAINALREHKDEVIDLHPCDEILMDTSNAKPNPFSHKEVRDVDLDDADLSDSRLSRVYFQTDMNSTDFSRSQLFGSTFENCEMNGVDFTDAGLGKAYFRGCKFRNCTFAGAYLQITRFEKCTFENACFTEATLWDATFSDSELNGVNFSGADTRSLRIIQCTIRSLTIEDHQQKREAPFKKIPRNVISFVESID